MLASRSSRTLPLQIALLFLASRVVEPAPTSDTCKTDRWSAGNAASDMILTHCSALSGLGNDASADFVLGKMRHGKVSTSGSVAYRRSGAGARAVRRLCRGDAVCTGDRQRRI